MHIRVLVMKCLSLKATIYAGQFFTQQVVEHYYWLLGRNGTRIHIVGRGIQLWDVLILAAVHAFSGVMAKPEARKFLRAGSAL